MKRFVFAMFSLLALSGSAAEWMKFPAYQRTVLPNGVTLLLVEKHGAPLINLNLALRSGSTQDPIGKEGLADITNDLLRKGAGSRSAEQIADDLDFIGATLNTLAGQEITRVQTEFLKKDFAMGLEIFSDLILRPKFPADEVAKILKQRVDHLKEQKDHPSAVISQYHRHFLFGTHSYGRPAGGDEVSIPKLTREDIATFHQQTYVASNMVIVACGDFASAEMQKQLSARFGTLPAKDIARTALSKPPTVTGKRLLLVDKPDSTQSFFRIGNVASAVNDPDRITMDLVNTLFGGRFTSRLNTALRIDSGLSYGANSSFERLRQPAGFTIGSFTKNATTEEALGAALKVLQSLHANGITEAELASGKAYIKGQFGPKLETPDQIAERLAYYEIYGLDPKVEVDQFATRLDAITISEAKHVIAEKFPSTNLVFTVIGKASEIAPLMKKFAPEVKTISINDPGFGKN
jgi:zinc protease